MYINLENAPECILSVCSMVSAQSGEVHRPLVAVQEHQSTVPASTAVHY